MNISGSQPQVTCELRQVQKHGADLTKLENLQKQQSEAQQYGGASSPEVLGCSFLKGEICKKLMFLGVVVFVYMGICLVDDVKR